ncbi:hypothetical protein BHE74_00018901 [Ensete ventricosum]|nr:hypothetical protein BHE74_00018901 [Ensete ventricosum]
MKSPLRLFRGLKLGRQEAKEEKQQHRPPMNMDKLIQATQSSILLYFESILYRYAISEFSEALEELGTCLLKKTALNDDEDSGEQINFRLDILRTMDKPSRSLLREFEVVEVCFL